MSTGGTPLSRPAILLDRDGTIIVERDYLSDPDGVELETDALVGLQRLSRAGWPLVVLTNQSGIARGYFDQAAANAVNARVAAMLEAGGVAIAGWYICPHGPNDGCDCRKPAPGLAYRAASELGLDLKRSWMIGDKPSDIGLGQAIGANTILVTTGHATSALSWANSNGITVVSTLAEAAESILATDTSYQTGI